jgi:hypothetical protein
MKSSGHRSGAGQAVHAYPRGAIASLMLT